MSLMSSPDLIRATQAAKILNRSPRTVKRLAKADKVPYVQKLDGDKGAYLFSRVALQEFRRAELDAAEAKFAAAEVAS